MANRVSYLNSKNTFWQDIDLKNVERDFFTDGVVDANNDAPSPSAVGSDLQVLAQSSPDKTVIVRKGVAYFRAERANDADGDDVADSLVLRFQNLAETSLLIPDNTSGADKTFEICCSIPSANMNAETINATASNIGELVVQEAGAGLQNKLLLATITVESGFTEVTQEKITDHRLRVAFKAVPKGLTATISEINLALDGILASSFDLNILEDTTVTKEEFNRTLTGTLVTAAELNLLHEVAGLTKADLQKLANIDATADEIDQALDGISPDVSASNLNILVGGGFTNLHKHATDPNQSGITESPAYFYLPSGQTEAVSEKGIMTRFFYQEDADEVSSENIEVVNDTFQNYESYYKKITSFENEAGETYIGGSFDTVEYNEGAQSRKRELSLDSTGTLLIEFATGKNLSAFSGSDTVEFWFFVTDLPNTDMATIQLGSTTPASNYFHFNFLSQITGSGWNKIKIPVSSLASVGTPTLGNIVRVRFEFSTNTNGSCNFNVDSLRIIKAANTTGGFWSNTAGEWEMQDIAGLKRFTKTNESSGDKDSVLSLGNQSRSYENGIFTARIRRLQGSGATGIKWRYTAPNNCYLVYFTTNELVVAKNSGAFSTIQTVTFPFTNGVDFWLKVSFNGNQIVVSTSTDGINFNTQISVTDSSITGEGQIALFDNGNIASFDQVVFEQTSVTYERDTTGEVVKIEENTGFGDKFDDQEIFERIYEASGGIWAIEENIDEVTKCLLQSDTSAGEKILLLKTDGLSNKFVNFTLRGGFQMAADGVCAFIFKCQDSDNFLRLQCKGGRISFVKRVAGVDTILGEEMAFTPVADSFFSLKIECDNNSFKYYYSEDGAVWILISEVSATDFTSGQIGIFAEDKVLRADELFAYEHNVGGDTFYQIYYDGDSNVSSIIKKPVVSN
ncbi:hypothetical protein IPN35_01985 [Candidatus Peregrinibacteria bacterium]|nr:MAG: hypothetical protein IPN35_01985 [Candidatus Peregrinibacteria bacterium]